MIFFIKTNNKKKKYLKCTKELLIVSWSWAEVYVMGERGTMIRLGLTLIWCFSMTSVYLCVTLLPSVYFVALGMQVCF